MSNELNDKQKMFCREYVVDFNATQAAIRAGYSKRSANRIASAMLSKHDIQTFVKELIEARSINTGINAQRVLNEYAKIAFVDIRKFYREDGSLKHPHELDDECAAVLAELTVDDIMEWNPDVKQKEKIGESKKIKMHSKLAALDALAKHLGLFEKDNAQKPAVSLNLTTEQVRAISKDLDANY